MKQNGCLLNLETGTCSVRKSSTPGDSGDDRITLSELPAYQKVQPLQDTVIPLPDLQKGCSMISPKLAAIYLKRKYQHELLVVKPSAIPGTESYGNAWPAGERLADGITLKEAGTPDQGLSCDITLMEAGTPGQGPSRDTTLKEAGTPGQGPSRDTTVKEAGTPGHGPSRDITLKEAGTPGQGPSRDTTLMEAGTPV
jgi:hypothetical protein